MPVTADTVMLPAKLSSCRRLRVGTWTSRLEITPCGLRSVSTPMRRRVPEPVKSSPEAPAPRSPLTMTSLRSHPMTRMEPAGFSISTSASAEALRRASTFWSAPAARAPRASARAAAPNVRAFLLDMFNSLGSIEAHDALERVDLLLVGRRQQVREL